MPAAKSLYMETTEIDPQKTAGEIISELVHAGSTSVNTEYTAGEISGLRWIMRVGGSDVLFDMPVRVEPIYKILEKRGRDSWQYDAQKTREKAKRVAWRQLLRWVQAQNAMIETGMVQAAEVYLPYMVNPGTGRTLFEHMAESGYKMLGDGRTQ